jgi:hypothetical protein
MPKTIKGHGDERFDFRGHATHMIEQLQTIPVLKVSDLRA